MPSRIYEYFYLKKKLKKYNKLFLKTDLNEEMIKILFKNPRVVAATIERVFELKTSQISTQNI